MNRANAGLTKLGFRGRHACELNCSPLIGEILETLADYGFDCDYDGDFCNGTVASMKVRQGFEVLWESVSRDDVDEPVDEKKDKEANYNRAPVAFAVDAPDVDELTCLQTHEERRFEDNPDVSDPNIQTRKERRPGSTPDAELDLDLLDQNDQRVGVVLVGKQSIDNDGLNHCDLGFEVENGPYYTGTVNIRLSAFLVPFGRVDRVRMHIRLDLRRDDVEETKSTSVLVTSQQHWHLIDLGLVSQWIKEAQDWVDMTPRRPKRRRTA